MPQSMGPFKFPSQGYFDVSEYRHKFIPLPIHAPSIDPALVLTELIKYRDWIGGPAITKFFLQDGPVNFRTLIGITESDDVAFSNLKHWVGVFSEAKIRIRNEYFDLVNAVESFMKYYPGERMRRVKWEERVAQGTGFSFHALRLRDWEYQSMLIQALPKEDSDRGESETEEEGDPMMEDWQTISDSMNIGSQSTHDHEHNSELGVGDTGDELSDDDDPIHGCLRNAESFDSTEGFETATTIKREPSIYSGNGDVPVNGIRMPGPRILETPAPQPTPSLPPAPKKRISRDWQRIASDKGDNEDASNAKPNDKLSDGSTKVFDSIALRQSALETTHPPQGGETRSGEVVDDMEDAIFEVLDDGTVLYESITLEVPSQQQVIPSTSNNGLSDSRVGDDEDAMEDVTNDDVSEAGTVINESITVRCPAPREPPSPPPSAIRRREGLRIVPRSNYRALNLGTL